MIPIDLPHVFHTLRIVRDLFILFIGHASPLFLFFFFLLPTPEAISSIKLFTTDVCRRKLQAISPKKRVDVLVIDEIIARRRHEARPSPTFTAPCWSRSQLHLQVYSQT
jgi:hypothetical protein